MNEEIIKSACAALDAVEEEAMHDAGMAGAVKLLLEKALKLGPKLGYFITVFDATDPVEEESRTTYVCGDIDQVATALGMEMIDDKDVRFILNNARVNLDLFNEGLPENEKLK